VGRYRERRHLASIVVREAALADIPVTNLKRIPDPDSVGQSMLVCGDAVIATDYFKSFAAKLRGIIGGEMRSYQTLMGRARREATLRMLEQARAAGATEVWNVRYETSNIRSAGRRQAAVSVEAFAFGTAIVRK
jgi:uncharacterized protein YbjQ (UPF0145 family)